MKILVINAGSSSIKYQLFNMPEPVPVCTGQVEKIGGDAELKQVVIKTASEIRKTIPVKDHNGAMKVIIDLLTDKQAGVIQSADEISVVGHRIVHGGEDFSDATIITAAVKERIRSLFTLAPLHNPVNYTCLTLAEEYFHSAKQVAVFDTAFHQTLPDYAYRFAIPASWYHDEQIRVYGFHGTSHQYICDRTREYLGTLPAKLITIHLGNGCSMAAVKDGQSIDTSMGFGPLSGLIMGTRSGDIDASVIFYLAEKSGMSIREISDLLNKKSGMIGMTGSNDMRDLRKKVEAGDAEAILAEKMYVYRIRKYIGAYAATLNGLDAILFTAGVGENDAVIRRLVCSDMDYLGIGIDNAKNNSSSGTIREIQSDNARVRVMIVPTNEELEIARQSYELVLKS